MNNTYLSRITISDYRTYGSGFELEIPQEPGLTIICGKNGLGKTAFVEAVEWALTGSIQRLKSRFVNRSTSLDSLIRRNEAGTNSVAEVTLEFDCESVVRRSTRKGESTDEISIVNSLKAPQWAPVIHDVGAYLRLTHFLPQSSRERFLERDNNEQWSLLKGPAGVERLERFRGLLDDGKARNAFKRKIGELERRRDDAKQAVESLAGLLNRQEELRSRASSLQALAPEKVAEGLRELRRNLDPIAGTESVVFSDDPAAELVAFVEALDRETERLQSQLRQTELAGNTLTEWNDLRSKFAENEKLLSATEAELSKRQETLADARSSKASVQKQLDEAAAVRRKAIDRRESLKQLVTAHEQILRLEDDLPKQQEKIAASQKHLEDCHDQLNTYAQDRQNREDTTRKWDDVRKSLSELDDFSRLFRTANDANEGLPDVTAQRETLIKQKLEASNAKQEVETQLAQTRREIDEIHKKLDEEKRTADAISRAVIEIASHLTDHDTECPVCLQNYEKSELLVRTRQAISRVSTGAKELEEMLAADKQRLTEQTEVQRQAQEALIEIDRSLSSAEAAITKCTQLRTMVEGTDVVSGIPFEEVAEFIQSRREELATAEKELADRLSDLPSEDTMSTRQIELEGQRDLADTAQRQLRADHDSQRRTLEEWKAVPLAHAQLVEKLKLNNTTPSDELEDLQLELSQLETTSAALRDQIESIQENEAAATESVTEIETRREMVSGKLQRLKDRLEILQAVWTEYGIDGDPDDASLAAQRTQLAEMQSTCRGLRERHQALAIRFEQWNQNEALRRTKTEVDQIIAAGNYTDIEDCSSGLNARLGLFNRQLANAKEAQEHASQIASTLHEQSELFSNSALSPLNDRIHAFNKVLSPFPYEFRIESKQSKTRSSVKQSIRVPNHVERTASVYNPAAQLSEGQMSALGLSVLFGASVEYRWSRWPALVLDDPLQNNDLIHAAAFIDVIRGLMIDQGFQIIVSTHDTHEADFIGRRCRRAGLPVQTCELLGPGPSGVRWKAKLA